MRCRSHLVCDTDNIIVRAKHKPEWLLSSPQLLAAISIPKTRLKRLSPLDIRTCCWSLHNMADTFWTRVVIAPLSLKNCAMKFSDGWFPYCFSQGFANPAYDKVRIWRGEVVVWKTKYEWRSSLWLPASVPCLIREGTRETVWNEKWVQSSVLGINHKGVQLVLHEIFNESLISKSN